MRVIRQIKVSAYDQFFGGGVQVLRTVHILFGLRMIKAKYARSVPPHDCGEGSSRVPTNFEQNSAHGMQESLHDVSIKRRPQPIGSIPRP